MLMLHHLKTVLRYIQVGNLVNYNCHPSFKRMANRKVGIESLYIFLHSTIFSKLNWIVLISFCYSVVRTCYQNIHKIKPEC